MHPAAFIALVLCAATVQADVYRWVDRDGVVHYGDRPQAADAKPAQLPPLQTYPAGSAPPLPDTTAAAPAARPSVSISSPAPDETIRENSGQLGVRVEARLQPGQGLLYYLDGVAQNASPTPSTAFMLTGVERGEHSISVAVVDAGGTELGRSEAVTVHFKPPSVRH